MLSNSLSEQYTKRLQKHEAEVFGNGQVLLDFRDIAFVVTEIWRHRCAYTVRHSCVRVRMAGYVLRRWRRGDDRFLP